MDKHTQEVNVPTRMQTKGNSEVHFCYVKACNPFTILLSGKVQKKKRLQTHKP